MTKERKWKLEKHAIKLKKLVKKKDFTKPNNEKMLISILKLNRQI